MKNRDIQEYYKSKGVESTGRSSSSISEANQAERDLGAQLILVATVVVGVTGAILAAGVVNETATLIQGASATVAVVFALVSIACGVRYYFILIDFNFGWAKTHQDVAHKFEAAAEAIGKADISDYDRALGEASQLIEHRSENTPRGWLYAELATLLTAVLGLFLLVAAVVFDWGQLIGFKFL